MKNKIIPLHLMDASSAFLGNKTLNLKKCVDWGFDVPNFVALPSHISRELLASISFRNKIAQEVKQLLHTDRYVVRSSAMIEDGKSHSFAGQFLTKINLSSDELICAIEEILRQADVFLAGDLDNFSLIIQEYIVADISGVTFTRNPDGNREMVIEYGFCEGERIVSGEIAPSRISFYWEEQLRMNLPKEFIVNDVIAKFKKIENKNSSPQDIEWCIKDNHFYILQTRSITTISSQQYKQILFLENCLPKQGKYYFEKTEISEISPRPTMATYDILRFIYAQDGPVAKVYEKYGVNYESVDFLKIVGNELFVDREKELQGLLPAYSYLQNKNFTPKFHQFSKLVPTVKNFFFLNKIRTDNYVAIFNSLKERIEAKKTIVSDVRTALNEFLTDYELIFEVNLLSGLLIKKINLLLKNAPVNFSEILSAQISFVDLARYQVDVPMGLMGNSLDLSDETIFMAAKNAKNRSNAAVTEWWEKVPEYKKKVLQSKIIEAIVYNRIREMGRWLTIKNMNSVREVLLACAAEKGFKDLRDIYFAKLADILNDEIDEVACLKDKVAYQKYNQLHFPNKLTSSLISISSQLVGVSSGSAEGVLQDYQFIDATSDQNEKVILYTEMLHPSLTQYFDRISGIVSHNGGLLSHLAIMARENNIPVVVGCSLTKNDFKLGDYVQIDGGSGNVLKI
ncbi:MAG: PEP/pyruvate-binding domain-containing protein [Parcubacteria group bacterium]|jgi:phosphohistidine swiveling domain-containing protein